MFPAPPAQGSVGWAVTGVGWAGQGTQKAGFVSRAAGKYSPSFHMLRDSQKGTDIDAPRKYLEY